MGLSRRDGSAQSMPDDERPDEAPAPRSVARAAAALRRKSATMVGSGAGYAPGHAPKLPELKRAQTTGLAAAAAAMSWIELD